MQHMVNKAYTRWVAANLISDHVVHAGNLGKGLQCTDGVRAVLSKQWSVRKPMAFGQGVVVTGG